MLRVRLLLNAGEANSGVHPANPPHLCSPNVTLLTRRVLALELFTANLPAQARPLGILGETQAQSCLFREGTSHSFRAVDLGTAEQEAALGDTPAFPSTGEVTSLHKLVTSGKSLALHSQNLPEEGGLEVLCV